MFDLVENEIKEISLTKLKDIKVKSEPFWTRGIISAKRRQITRRGSIDIIEIDDGEVKVEVNVFKELYDRVSEKIKIDQLVLILANVENDEYAGGLRINANDLLNITDMRKKFASRILIEIIQNNSDRDLSEVQLKELEKFLTEKKSTKDEGLPVSIKIQIDDLFCELRLSSQWKIIPDDEILDKIKLSPYINSAKVSYTK